MKCQVYQQTYVKSAELYMYQEKGWSLSFQIILVTYRKLTDSDNA